MTFRDRGSSARIASTGTSSSRGDAVLARLVCGEPSDLLGPRLLVVLAHPDDEVLALGARMERLRASRLLAVTDGAPENGADARAHEFATLEAYRDARRAELDAALRLSGLPLECAGPLRLRGGRMLADQGAAFHLVELTRAVLREIEEFQPEAVFTHPYEGGHPDHDSCAFAVHAAVRLAVAEVPILEAPFYHAGPSGIETGVFLPALGDGADAAERVCELAATEQARKRERLACFVTQRETLAQFGTEVEKYRIAPPYDFMTPPHPGRLFYEGFSWGLDGARFRELAGEALRELGLEQGFSGCQLR